MRFGLSEALPSLVKAKFEAAKASSSLVFSPSELAIIRTSTGSPFQLRFCPSLAKKPVPKKSDATPKQKIDPFDNPPPALHVADVPAADPTHLIVVNKFPIIKEHFILATKKNKKQTHFLEQDDLEATYACLRKWAEASGGEQQLFAFFNSGDHSGASQPHRHLQFLPVDAMREGEIAGSWKPLIESILDTMESIPTCMPRGNLTPPYDLPFEHYALLFGDEPSGPDLLSMYRDLYQASKVAVDRFIAANPGRLDLHANEDDDLPISYNFAMTTTGMVMMPRRSEGTILRRNDGSEIGFVALNGTTLGGTMMVKHQEEYEALREKPELLDTILTAIGIPKELPSSRPHV